MGYQPQRQSLHSDAIAHPYQCLTSKCDCNTNNCTYVQIVAHVIDMTHFYKILCMHHCIYWAKRSSESDSLFHRAKALRIWLAWQLWLASARNNIGCWLQSNGSPTKSRLEWKLRRSYANILQRTTNPTHKTTFIWQLEVNNFTILSQLIRSYSFPDDVI